MTPENRKEFLEIVIGFAELKGKHLSAPALALYWRAMSGWTIDEFRVAAEHLLRTCEFMPTPADFENLKKAGKYTAAEAWDLVLEHCKGAYRNGAGIDDGGPIDMAVRGLGGYRAVAFHDTDYLPILQRQFVDRFEELDDAMEIRHAVPMLVDQNTRTEIRHDAPRRLGALLGNLPKKPKREDAA